MAPYKTSGPISLFFSLIVVSVLILPAVHSMTVVHPYDWVEVGAYMRYYSPNAEVPEIFLPNGTGTNLWKVYSVVLEWTVVGRTGNQIRLNVTFEALGRSYIYGEINHSKTLFVDVDLYTRESLVDGEPIGKTCFWVEPYREEGDNITLFTNPDSLIGVGWKVLTSDSFKTGLAIKHCSVGLFQNDPNAQAFGHYSFSYWTGVCLSITLIGPPWTVPPELFGNFISRYDNGTEYNITRHAGTRIGELLGIGPHGEFKIYPNATNIDLSVETEPDSTDPPSSLWQYAPHVAAAALITVTATTIVLRRRKRHTQQGK